MTRILTPKTAAAASLVLVLFLGLANGTAAQDNRPTVTIAWVDSQAFPKVAAYVAVSDGGGSPLFGLTEADFVIFEDSNRVSPASIAVESDFYQDLRLVLAIDVSMPEESLDSVREAVASFIDTGLGPQDQVAIVTFHRGVRIVQDFTNDAGALKATIDNLTTEEPSTALNRAVRESVDMLSEFPSGRRAVIVLTHSEDDGTSLSSDAPISKAQDIGVPVYVIGFGPRVDEPGALYDIARSTGGQAFVFAYPDNIEGTLEIVEGMLRPVYKVTFRSGLRADAEEHRLTIRVKYQGRGRQTRGSFVARPDELRWLKRSAIVVAVAVVTAAITIPIIARSQRKTLRKKLRLEIRNVGNIRSRYELRAEDTTGTLRFQFAVGRASLPTQQVIKEIEVAEATGVEAEVEAREPAPARSGPDLKGAKQKAQRVKGISGVAGSVIGGLGALLPGSLGASLKNISRQMQTGQAAATRTVRIPKEKLGQAGKLRGQIGKVAPTGSHAKKGGPLSRVKALPSGAAAESQRVPAAPSTSAVRALVQSWAWTPFVEPDETLLVDLLIDPAKRLRRSQDCSLRISSRIAGLEEAPLVVEEKNIQIEGVSWLRLYLPALFIGAAIAFGSLLSIAVLVVSTVVLGL